MFAKNRWWVFILVFILLISEGRVSAAAQGVSGQSPQVQQDLLAQCLVGSSNIARHDQTGVLSFVGTTANAPIKQLSVMDGASSPEQAARAYLSACGSLFGLADQSSELQMKKLSQTEDERHVLRFQQTYQGVPVFAGELHMQLTRNHDVILVNGEVLPDIKVDTAPTVSADSAQQAALHAIAEEYQLADHSTLEVSQPELWIYNPGLIGNPEGPSVLAWRMEVAQARPLPIRHLVLVDAQDGSIALNLSRIHTARNLETYDMANGTDYSAATLVCDSSDPTCDAGGTNTDAINAHVYAGDAYDFYMNYHERDSIDNAGMTLKSYVHYDSGWCNARWTGSEMIYGDDCTIVADDVVAHELTHGVTDYESGLVYQNQSGAINESFSDLWGEYVDQTNGKGTDSATVLWQIGEDAYEVIRDMKDPPNYDQPDKMSSTFYHTGPDDYGGVHTNSGVGNKAAYLITDGGSFNDYSVGGLGIYKAAKIFYEVQTNVLTSGAKYADLGNALIQACNTLVGTDGITDEDCTQVRNAIYATEMLVPTPTQNSPSTNIKDRTPGYAWQAVRHATQYQLQLKQGLFNVYTMTVASSACGTVNCTTTPTIALGYKSYSWRVRAQVANVWGPWSSYMTFTVIRPLAKTPSGDIADQTPTYTWTKEGGATQYHLQLKQGLFNVYTVTVGSGACAVSTCSYTPATSLDYKSYKWRVRAKDGGSGVWGGWSVYKSFRVVQNIGFNSTFNNSMNGWKTVNGTWTILNSAYLNTNGLLNKGVSVYHSQKFPKLNYQVRMKRLGCTGCANALLVRGEPFPTSSPDIVWNKGYYFAYNNSGSFVVYEMINGSFYALKPWATSSAINQGGWNTLQVIASGSTLRFYINGTLVWMGSDATYTNGFVGIRLYRDYLSTGNKLYVDWAKLNTTGFDANLGDEQVESGQIELDTGNSSLSPEYIAPVTP
jgi:Zn-dependent metalloprotease